MAASDFLTIYRNAPPEEVETMLRDGRLKVDPGFDFALYNRDAQAKRQVEEDRRAALDGLPEEEEPIQTAVSYTHLDVYKRQGVDFVFQDQVHILGDFLEGWKVYHDGADPAAVRCV